MKKSSKQIRPVMGGLMLATIQLFFLSSCVLIDLFKPNETKVVFDIAATSRGFGVDGSRNLDSSAATGLIWLDISRHDAVLQRRSITSGTNELRLPKDGIYLIGFVNDTAQDRGMRAISSAIMTLGNLKVVSAGLDSLPLSSQAADELDLGTLGTNNFASALALDAASSKMGFESATLQAFGVFDGSLRKLLNPDVDRNGQYDTDQNLEWMLTSLRYIDFASSQIGSDFSVSKSVEALRQDLRALTLVFWLNGNFAHPPLNLVRLYLPPDQSYFDYFGNPVSFIQPNHEGLGEGGGKFNQYYFSISSLLQQPVPTYNGDYELDLNGSRYYWNDISFIDPSGGSIDGFVFPATVVSYTAGGILDTISWRWKAVQGSGYRDADEEEVRLKIREFYYYLGTDGGNSATPVGQFGVPYYRNGTIRVASYNLSAASLGGRLDCDYWDRAGTDYKFVIDLD